MPTEKYLRMCQETPETAAEYIDALEHVINAMDRGSILTLQELYQARDRAIELVKD